MNHLVIPATDEKNLWGFHRDAEAVIILYLPGQPTRLLRPTQLASCSLVSKEYKLVVLCRARMCDKKSQCLDWLKSLMIDGSWYVWIHEGQGQPVTQQLWVEMVKSPDWQEFAFLQGETPRVAQYSYGAMQRSGANPIIQSVHVKVAAALTSGTSSMADDVIGELDRAAAIADVERDYSTASDLLEGLFPLVLDDPSGAGIDPGLKEQLKRLLAELSQPIPEDFEKQFEHLSKYVTDCLRGFGKVPQGQESS